jgi:hypothetical protein
MNRRPQFTLRALLVLMLVVAAFFGGVRLGRERQKREDQLAAEISYEEAIKNFREMKARLLQPRPKISSPNLRVIPDVVWEDPGPNFESPPEQSGTQE